MAHLSAEERRLYTEAFLDYDKDGNGFLTLDEFWKSDLSKMGFTNQKRKEMNRITFEDLDKNQDGKITLDEYLVVCSKLQPKVRKAAEIRRWFQAMDLDLDGKVSEAEFLAFLRSKGSCLSEANVHAMFVNTDKDLDGKLTIKEFIQSVLKDG